MHLHKALLKAERVSYERVNGRVQGPGHFYQLVVADPWFAWLHPISEFIVQIDEMLEAKEQPSEANAQELIRQAKDMLTPAEMGSDFQRRYYEALQFEPSVVLLHADVASLLRDAADIPQE